MKKFPWGKVLGRFDYDFDGAILEIVKYHPWISVGCTVKSGVANESETWYHIDTMHASFSSMDEALVNWITFKNLGMNNSALAGGICRALCIKSE